MVNAASTLTTLLNQCKSMSELKQIHAQTTTLGLTSILTSNLLHFSAVSDAGDILYADRLFRSLPSPPTTPFLYNALIRGFSKPPHNPNTSLSLYARMRRAAVSPDHLTFPFLAKSCARLSSLPLSASLHAHITKLGLAPDIFIANSIIHMYAACRDIASAHMVFDGVSTPNSVSWNSLLDGYAKCGDLAAARTVFDRMPARDIISWSAMIDGYVKGGEYREALTLFEAMRALDSGPRANAVTMVSVLCACAHLGALDLGRKMHRYVTESGMRLSLQLSTSLVDMYAKCGAISEAMWVFRSLRMDKTDVLIWNAVIGGLALHGMWKESLELFRLMQSVGVMPDEITYLGLLSACSHGGLVDDAWGFFRSLEAQGMVPQIEHYACMVDVLGRSGRVEEAYEFVKGMPMEPSASLLGALLNGCRTHGRVQLGEIVGRRLIELEPDHDGRYVGLSNVYALARRWDDAKTMREVMESRGVRKVPGFSMTEVDGTLHRFIAHDGSHPQSVEIYLMLRVLVIQMKEEFEFDTTIEGLCCHEP